MKKVFNMLNQDFFIYAFIRIFMFILVPVSSITSAHTNQNTFLICSIPSHESSNKYSDLKITPNIFTTVEEMKSANISLGSISYTEGFYTNNDMGGAKYIISATPSFPLSTNMSLSLNNGLFANLLFDSNSIINIQSFGINSGNDISATLNSALPYLSGKIDGIRFPEGNYYIESPIILHSINLYGTDNSVIIIDGRYSSECFACIRSNPEENNKIGFYNIHIIANIDNSFRRKAETTLLYLKSISECNIINCKFEAHEASDINTFVPINLVWFQTESASNISISNSSFQNNTGLYYHPGTTEKLHGGCLWFSGEKSFADMNNITIHKCDFFSSTADEHVAIWRGNYRNISFNECFFSNSSTHISDNYLTFYSGSFNSITINNTNLQINSSTMYPIKFTDFTATSDFTMSNCHINLNFAEKSDPNCHSFSIIYIDQDQLSEHDIPVQIMISDCSFTATSNRVYYRSVIQCKKTTNKTLILQNCITNIKSKFGILNIDPNNSILLNQCPSFNE